MRKILFGLSLFILSFATYADCPDNDFDGYPESCIQEGQLIPSADNCPAIYNPDQRYPLRWTLSAITGAYLWVADETGAGLQCNYDINGDGVLNLTDHAVMALFTRGDPTTPYAVISPDKVGKIADYDLDGVYRLNTPITSQDDVPDLCRFEAGIEAAGVFLPYYECPSNYK